VKRKRKLPIKAAVARDRVVISYMNRGVKAVRECRITFEADNGRMALNEMLNAVLAETGATHGEMEVALMPDIAPLRVVDMPWVGNSLDVVVQASLTRFFASVSRDTITGAIQRRKSGGGSLTHISCAPAELLTRIVTVHPQIDVTFFGVAYLAHVHGLIRTTRRRDFLMIWRHVGVWHMVTVKRGIIVGVRRQLAPQIEPGAPASIIVMGSAAEIAAVQRLPRHENCDLTVCGSEPFEHAAVNTRVACQPVLRMAAQAATHEKAIRARMFGLVVLVAGTLLLATAARTKALRSDVRDIAIFRRAHSTQVTAARATLKRAANAKGELAALQAVDIHPVRMSALIEELAEFLPSEAYVKQIHVAADSALIDLSVKGDASAAIRALRRGNLLSNAVVATPLVRAKENNLDIEGVSLKMPLRTPKKQAHGH
jgi:hypothetical protein